MKRQLSKSFTVVIQHLSTRLIKPNFCFGSCLALQSLEVISLAVDFCGFVLSMEMSNQCHHLSMFHCDRASRMSFGLTHSFPRASLSENCSLLGTDNVRGQISEHIFAPNEGHCLYMKTSALQNKRVGVLQMDFRARSVLGIFEKRPPGP